MSDWSPNELRAVQQDVNAILTEAIGGRIPEVESLIAGKPAKHAAGIIQGMAWGLAEILIAAHQGQTNALADIQATALRAAAKEVDEQ